MEYTKEFKNLVSLVESPNTENVILGLQVAQNYKSEILAYFGYELEVLKDLTDFLMQNDIWKGDCSIFEIKVVCLGRDVVTEIPKSVFILKKITGLSITHSDLQEISKEIGELTKLKRLLLSCNKLQSIPKEIGKQKNLELLALPDNQLKSIPPEIGKLKKLGLLGLENNQLQSLPAEIGNLINLRTLHLYDNQLQSLPKGIDKLTNLKQLDIRNNKIPTKEIAHLQKMLPNCKIIT